MQKRLFCPLSPSVDVEMSRLLIRTSSGEIGSGRRIWTSTKKERSLLYSSGQPLLPEVRWEERRRTPRPAESATTHYLPGRPNEHPLGPDGHSTEAPVVPTKLQHSELTVDLIGCWQLITPRNKKRKCQCPIGEYRSMDPVVWHFPRTECKLICWCHCNTAGKHIHPCTCAHTHTSRSCNHCTDFLISFFCLSPFSQLSCKAISSHLSETSRMHQRIHTVILTCKFRDVHTELSLNGPPVFQLSLDLFSLQHASIWTEVKLFFKKNVLKITTLHHPLEKSIYNVKNDSSFERGIEIYFPPTSLQAKIWLK